MSRVFLGVGSNEGDRLAYISRAIRLMGAIPGVRVAQLATITETAPIGGPPQDPFLNTVVELDTTVAPRELLAALHAIEHQLGRRRTTQRWGPRPIDLDLLLYDEQVVQDPLLCIPHPRMHERRFVLEPLAQLAPEVMHPVLQQSIAELLERVTTSVAAGNPARADQPS